MHWLNPPAFKPTRLAQPFKPMKKLCTLTTSQWGVVPFDLRTNEVVLPFDVRASSFKLPTNEVVMPFKFRASSFDLPTNEVVVPFAVAEFRVGGSEV
jgi:hypothetical protein